MTIKLPYFTRTTSFRLAVVHAFLFALFTLGLLIFIYNSTAGDMRTESIKELNSEVQALGASFRAGGMERLNQTVIERSSVPGPFFYVLEDPTGLKVSGDFAFIPDEIPAEGSNETYFDYQMVDRNGDPQTRSAHGIIIRLPNQASLLIAYDLEARTRIVSRVTHTIWLALPIGLLMSLIGGLVISRWAARRVEALSKTTDGVMSGDMSLRAPITPVGDEFDRLSEQLNAMLDRLEHLMGMTRHAGDAIAHDLRSPLTRLRNRLEDDLSLKSEADKTAAIQKAIVEVDAVLQTFNAILSLSKVQAGQTQKFETVDITDLLEQLAELYGPAAEDTGLEFKAEISENLSLTCDKSLLAQSVTNLLDNAIKYTPDGGALVLRGRKTRANEVEISVTDTGPGIPEADRERVTRRFVRLEASRTQAGNGLGLAMVAAIANLHSGRLVLDDGPGPENNPGLRAALIFTP